MPTYEYKCDECGHAFELFQKMSDEPAAICPRCQGAVKRLPGKGAGIIFKGAGFHVNDYKAGRPACGREKPCCGRDVACADSTCRT